MKRVFFGVLLLGALIAACAQHLTQAWKVIQPRLFAVRVEVEGDPTRSRPKPGESFHLRQFMVLPPDFKEGKLADLYDMQLAVCLGFTAPDGRAVCAGDLDVPGSTTVVSNTELRTDPLPVPALADLIPTSAATQLGQVDQLTVFGAVCVQGKAERIPNQDLNTTPPSKLFRCTHNQGAAFPEPLAFTFSLVLDLGRPGDLNHNPELACDPMADGGACNAGVEEDAEQAVSRAPIVLVGPEGDKTGGKRKAAAWNGYPTPESLPWTGCKGNSDLPQVKAKSGEHLIRVRFDPSDREHVSYDDEESGKPVQKTVREELLISHALTEHGGRLDRYFSVLARDLSDSAAEIELPWTPPGQSDKAGDEIPHDGRLVRFYFAVRDQRGGVDFTTRELCLLPP